MNHSCLSGIDWQVWVQAMAGGTLWLLTNTFVIYLATQWARVLKAYQRPNLGLSTNQHIYYYRLLFTVPTDKTMISRQATYIKYCGTTIQRNDLFVVFLRTWLHTSFFSDYEFNIKNLTLRNSCLRFLSDIVCSVARGQSKLGLDPSNWMTGMGYSRPWHLERHTVTADIQCYTSFTVGSEKDSSGRSFTFDKTVLSVNVGRFVSVNKGL